MTRPDLDALAALLDKATPFAATALERDLVNALPALIARVRELERERDAAALAMRERCAQACEKVRDRSSGSATECAAAIRALET